MQAPPRLFILNALTVGAALAGARLAPAQTAPAIVKEDDPTAVAPSYATDATRIDAKKQPVYVPDSRCSTGALFQGTAGDLSAPSPVFGGKQVAAKGWCADWSRKA